MTPVAATEEVEMSTIKRLNLLRHELANGTYSYPEFANKVAELGFSFGDLGDQDQARIELGQVIAELLRPDLDHDVAVVLESKLGRLFARLEGNPDKATALFYKALLMQRLAATRPSKDTRLCGYQAAERVAQHALGLMRVRHPHWDDATGLKAKLRGLIVELKGTSRDPLIEMV